MRVNVYSVLGVLIILLAFPLIFSRKYSPIGALFVLVGLLFLLDGLLSEESKYVVMEKLGKI